MIVFHFENSFFLCIFFLFSHCLLEMILAFIPYTVFFSLFRRHFQEALWLTESMFFLHLLTVCLLCLLFFFVLKNLKKYITF